MKLQLIWITFVCPNFFFKIQISDWNLKMVLRTLKLEIETFISLSFFFSTLMSSAVGVSGIKEIWLKKMWKFSSAWLGAAAAAAGAVVGECK